MSDPAAISALYDLTRRDDLPSLLADVLIAIAITREDSPTPHAVAREASRGFGWSEETWREVVAPHIRQELGLERQYRAQPGEPPPPSEPEKPSPDLAIPGDTPIGHSGSGSLGGGERNR